MRRRGTKKSRKKRPISLVVFASLVLSPTTPIAGKSINQLWSVAVATTVHTINEKEVFPDLRWIRANILRWRMDCTRHNHWYKLCGRKDDAFAP
ncbi:hypothetical protein HOY80DRAFT_333693 [Tuber brumale]|nr:hypothetical protein HOY80DRAFT_333693 [Tuber brumale]